MLETFSEHSSSSCPDVALRTSEDPNPFVTAFRLTVFRHLNDPFQLGVDIVVAQSYRVDDDIQHEKLQRRQTCNDDINVALPSIPYARVTRKQKNVEKSKLV